MCHKGGGFWTYSIVPLEIPRYDIINQLSVMKEYKLPQSLL